MHNRYTTEFLTIQQGHKIYKMQVLILQHHLPIFTACRNANQVGRQ